MFALRAGSFDGPVYFQLGPIPRLRRRKAPSRRASATGRRLRRLDPKASKTPAIPRARAAASC